MPQLVLALNVKHLQVIDVLVRFHLADDRKKEVEVTPGTTLGEAWRRASGEAPGMGTPG